MTGAGKHFDPDALLAALPRRAVSLAAVTITRGGFSPAVPTRSALGERGQYNGFSGLERDRTARLSQWLSQVGGTERGSRCAICGGKAGDEHAENYYDLSTWIALCHPCHRTTLHGRFSRPAKWQALLDRHDLPTIHWTRFVSMQPFDLAGLIRSRGCREPGKRDFLSANQPV